MRKSGGMAQGAANGNVAEQHFAPWREARAAYMRFRPGCVAFFTGILLISVQGFAGQESGSRDQSLRRRWHGAIGVVQRGMAIYYR